MVATQSPHIPTHVDKPTHVYVHIYLGGLTYIHVDVAEYAELRDAHPDETCVSDNRPTFMKRDVQKRLKITKEKAVNPTSRYLCV